jgi:HSP20 family protein
MKLVLRNGNYYKPFSSSENYIPSTFGKIFEDFFAPQSTVDEITESFMPRINLRETEKEFEVYAELPGIDEKDVDITLVEDSLLIKGEKKSEKKTDTKDKWYFESNFGHFERTIHIPSEIERDNVRANFKNGVLQITLPKAPEAQNRVQKIKVN